MTREEAIGHLKNIAIYSVQDGYTDEARQALDMAIKALEEPERKTGTCDECIHKYRFDYEPPCKMCIRIASKGRDGDYFCKDGDDNET